MLDIMKAGYDILPDVTESQCKGSTELPGRLMNWYTSGFE